ncbi:hypothetical protein Corgl_0234 [Coriobacterium glomerans PW2]|uniref:Glycosyltransferase RgtA/B/C/D-like domain-containing protein n=1 Tax=Coriobacterium glomerans (strain ATCC 49209 / DSM 20642 / JCM 10262 / PW2) TaxID=700015 RepID=F2N722_CORGP|nr:hypothetical protein [Coriobacterium glomerans]AEB06361.1 hypothetical protein Corgl_0234 [Coriobacterium glomerans PW2]
MSISDPTDKRPTSEAEDEPYRSDGVTADGSQASRDFAGSRLSPRPTGAGLALERALVACVMLFLGVTGLSTLLVTASLPNYDNAVVFSFSRAPLVVAGIAVILAFLLRVCGRGVLVRIDERKLAIGVVVYALIAGTIWVLSARVWPDWDSLDLINAALEMGQRGSIFYEHGGYLYRFPYQMGYVFLIRLVSLVAHGHTYLLLEALNIVFTAWILYLVIAITRELFASRRAVGICCVLCLLFLPLIFYVTFAYAIAIGLAFALLGLLLQIRAIARGSKRLGFESALAISASCILKSNMLVALAAMAVVWLCHLIGYRALSSACGLATLLAVYATASLSISLITLRICGMETSHGIPTSVPIAMGLSDTGGENYGWYNGYSWKYDAEHYSVERYDREARTIIRSQVDRFVADPGYAWTFFSKKYWSEWCMPTYESLLASNWRGSSRPEVPVMTKRPYTPLARIVYYGALHDAILGMLDVLQTLIIAGALIEVISDRIRCRRDQRRRDPGCASDAVHRGGLRVQHMGPLLFAAGSALFYLFWEAQSQYVMPAYVALLPFAAGGISVALDGIGCRHRTRAVEETSR